MKIIPEVKCRRCGESFSALRSTCPNCGTRRVAQSTRTPAATPSSTAGTAAYERANVNTRWQMIFGLILVAAVILQTAGLMAYFPVLMLCGIGAGLAVGLAGGIMISRLRPILPFIS